MASKPTAEQLRGGDPAFIIDRAEALEILEDEALLPADVQEFYLCDGVVLWGDREARIFYDGIDHRATWFERERFLGKRGIIKPEEQL